MINHLRHSGKRIQLNKNVLGGEKPTTYLVRRFSAPSLYFRQLQIGENNGRECNVFPVHCFWVRDGLG